MTRTRRSLYSLAAMYLNTSVALVAGLVATPLLFDWLGDERLGLVRMGQQWLGYALLLSLGLDGALSVHFAKAAASEDRAGLLAVIRGGVRAYVAVAIGSMTWVGVLAAAAPTFFNLQNCSLLTELRWGLLAAAIGQLTVLLSAFKPLAEAQQRGYVAYLCAATGWAVSCAASLLFAYSGFGLPGQFSALALAPLVCGLLLASDAVRRYPELLKHPGGKAIHTVRSFDRPMLIYQICSRTSFLSDAIIVGLILGPLAVAPFHTTQALIGLIQGVILGIGNATWGALANLHHSGQHQAFDHRLIQLTRFVSILACAAMIPAAVWNETFVIAWVKEPGRFAGQTLSYLTAVALILMCLCATWGWPLVTTGRVRKQLPYLVGGAVINVSLATSCTYFFGSTGTPIGTIVNHAVILLGGYALLVQREFGTPARKLLIAALAPCLLAVPYAFLLAQVAGHLNLEAWFPRRIARMGSVAGLIGISAALFIAVSGFTIMPAVDRREWLNRFRKRGTA